jgi:uncharacterized protein (DUF2384 family)
VSYIVAVNCVNGADKLQKRASKKTRKPAVKRLGSLKGRSFKKKAIAIGSSHSRASRPVSIGLTAIGGASIARYFDPDGRVAIKRVTAELGMSKKRLAETFGIAPVTLQRKARADAPKTQTRLREGLEIVNRVSSWAGGQIQAMAWYRAEPIPAFGGRTAESLVKEGKASAVRDYLDRVALGGFA